ncbi:MAG: hypothetical protein JXA33_26475 [Anaerolineae bacterium]|nr:hypothetical protein [Anaerolineae bacterium]
MKKKAWLLGLSSVFIVLFVVLFLAMIRQGRSTPVVGGYPQPGGSLTAQQAAQVFQEWASSWAEDTEIVAVSATLLKPDVQGAGWTFQVYSPSRQRLAIVVVEQSQVWVLKEKSAIYVQKGIPRTAWVLDSDAFMSRWWVQGGKGVWDYAEAQSMHVRLRCEKDGTVSWTINVISAKGALMNSWSIKADTGEIILVDIPGG